MRFQKLDLNLLVALDALLDTLSVTETARRLNLSQPSVSAALARLRNYFGDDLLVQVGRKMLPTAKADELSPAIKEMLNIVRFRITERDDFVPSESQRCFKIVASDYAFDVLVSQVLAASERFAPDVSFDISPPGPQRMRQFQEGEIDLFISVSDYTVEGHPVETLFHDEDSVISWSGGKYADGVSEADFLDAKHAVAVFGQERLPAVTERHFDNIGIDRKIAVRVPSFSALPAAIVGTDRIATIHKRHAQLFAEFFPIKLHKVPVEGPIIREVMQWHNLRSNDAGLRWLTDLLLSASRQLDAAPLSRVGDLK